MSILEEIAFYIETGKRKEATDLCKEALKQNIPPQEILNNGLMKGMNTVSEKFKKNELFIPHVLLAAGAMNAGVRLIDEYLAEQDEQVIAKVVVGTVRGDLHDIGKNLVKLLIEKNGFEVIDLGVNVEPEQFVQAAIENQAHIICCSALLTTTMHVLKEVVEAAENAGVRDQVKIMIGGAPTSEEYALAIGADAYTEDAASALDKVVEFAAMLQEENNK